MLAGQGIGSAVPKLTTGFGHGLAAILRGTLDHSLRKTVWLMRSAYLEQTSRTLGILWFAGLRATISVYLTRVLTLCHIRAAATKCGFSRKYPAIVVGNENSHRLVNAIRAWAHITCLSICGLHASASWG